MNPKQRAAEVALSYLRDGMVVGLGTGSTADYFLQALAAHLKAGRLRGIVGVPTSRQSERRAGSLGIPLTTLDEHPRPDVTVDGADEVDSKLNLIKGLGGALLREKIVAQNSQTLVIIADATKAVRELGSKSPLPVEVAVFGHQTHVDFFRKLGLTPTLRQADASAFVTDNGNYIYDCRLPAGIDAEALEIALRARAGVVGTGLFIHMVSVAIIADEETVQTRTRGC